jgi:hypothetical protein
MVAAKEQTDPILVQVVNEQTAPVERRSVPVSFSVGQVPVNIAPFSNKRIKLILSVTGANVFLCTSQAQALQVSTTYNAGAALVTGVYELVGSGEFWIVASQGTVVVGVIAEYEV